MSPGMVLLLFVSYLCIFIVGLVGNIMVMVVVVTRQDNVGQLNIMVMIMVNIMVMVVFITRQDQVG